MARLDAFVLPGEAFLLQFAAALELGVVALVVRRFLGLGGVLDLQPNVVDEGPQLRVGACLHLRFQLVGAFDEGLDPPELAVVRVDETTQEAKHWSSRSLAARLAGHCLGVDRAGCAPRRPPTTA